MSWNFEIYADPKDGSWSVVKQPAGESHDIACLNESGKNGDYIYYLIDSK